MSAFSEVEAASSNIGIFLETKGNESTPPDSDSLISFAVLTNDYEPTPEWDLMFPDALLQRSKDATKDRLLLQPHSFPDTLDALQGDVDAKVPVSRNPSPDLPHMFQDPSPDMYDNLDDRYPVSPGASSKLPKMLPLNVDSSPVLSSLVVQGPAVASSPVNEYPAVASSPHNENSTVTPLPILDLPVLSPLQDFDRSPFSPSPIVESSAKTRVKSSNNVPKSNKREDSTGGSVSRQKIPPREWMPPKHLNNSKTMWKDPHVIKNATYPNKDTEWKSTRKGIITHSKSKPVAQKATHYDTQIRVYETPYKIINRSSLSPAKLVESRYANPLTHNKNKNMLSQSPSTSQAACLNNFEKEISPFRKKLSKPFKRVYSNAFLPSVKFSLKSTQRQFHKLPPVASVTHCKNFIRTEPSKMSPKMQVCDLTKDSDNEDKLMVDLTD